LSRQLPVIERRQRVFCPLSTYGINTRFRGNPMALKWTDTLDIVIALDEAYPDVDPRYVNFVDLRDWTLALEEFDDDPAHSGEKILEAIQSTWIEERE